MGLSTLYRKFPASKLA
ncbi:hypothetical protein [Salmonella enterica]